MNARNRSLKALTTLQAWYFIPFSLWGLLHIRSFLWVTGGKADVWLVKTVCLLLATVGAVIGVAGRNDRVTPEIAALGIGTSAPLAAIDVWYAGKGRIRRVYLLDALANIGLIATWVAAVRARPFHAHIDGKLG